jgi:hypothetical protein
MDAESQKRKIRRFINGAIKEGIDAFCIYQWIERCHFEKWWEMGAALGAHLQPNSLNNDYEKRMEFILAECRRNHQQEKKAQDKTMGEMIGDLDGVKRVEAVQLLKKLGIDLDTKLKDIENVIQGRSSRRTSNTDLTGKSVRAIIVHGQTYPARTHKEAYLKVIQFVFQHHPQDKDRILNLQGRTRKYFSRNPHDLTKYRERIPDSDIYAELNENANTLYRRGKEVLQLYKMDHESFKIMTD